ncbi:Cytochrome b-c1 complex subunit 7, variant 2 [Orbilia oligospora]|nr:Cytochrome b-c1 complex subunit 7, variant 2 [Orbilia oligospora]
MLCNRQVIGYIPWCEDPQDRLAPWIRLNPSLWPRFLQAHFDGDEGLERLLHRENTGIFFFNWGRLVSQDKEQYEIGKRILASKPYDIGAIGDPLLRNLDHKRYYQWPDRPYRKYGMVSSYSDGTVFYHAVKEYVSFYSEDMGGVFTGILLVDPIRHHRIFDITFNFWYGGVDFDEHRTQCFLNPSGQEPSPNSSSYQTNREQTLLNEQPPVSDRFISTLQRYIGNPTPAPKTMSSNAYNQPLTPASNSIFKDKQDAASARLLTLSSAVDRVNRHGGGVFQALMSSMSIVRSQRAIAEAELVLKLTQLAFFFTLLGLIAAVFWMNVNELEGKLTWSLWLAVSLAASATTYALLYRVEILAGETSDAVHPQQVNHTPPDLVSHTPPSQTDSPSPASASSLATMAAVKKITNYIIARPKLFNFIKPIADRYCDLAGYRKVGLMYEDLLREESHTVQLALKRLPPRLAYDRAFRIRRALQCSVTHTLLPKEEWIKAEEVCPRQK